VNIRHMIAYVQVYIHIRKGIEVDISINNQRDVFLLQKAYHYAVEWMEQNNTTLTLVL
jgi:hypothetical protein